MTDDSNTTNTTNTKSRYKCICSPSDVEKPEVDRECPVHGTPTVDPASYAVKCLTNIEVTETAKGKLLELGLDQEKFLRIGVIAGGCSGFTYDAVIDDFIEDGDRVFYESGDVRIVSDQQSSQYLQGLSIDYSDDLVQAGFQLTNKNAVKSCGCGSSFATSAGCGT